MTKKDEAYLAFKSDGMRLAALVVREVRRIVIAMILATALNAANPHAVSLIFRALRF